MAPTEHRQRNPPNGYHRIPTGPLAGHYAVTTPNHTELAFEWRTNQRTNGWYFIADVTNPEFPQTRGRVLRIPDRYFRESDTPDSDPQTDPASESDAAEEDEAAAQLEIPPPIAEEESIPDPTPPGTFLSTLSSPQAGPSLLRGGPSGIRIPSDRPGTPLPSSHSPQPERSDLRVHTIPTTPPIVHNPVTTTTALPTPPVHQSQPQLPPPTMTTKPTELKIGQPKAFSGDRATTAAFIQACKNYFSINDQVYDTDLKKIGFALSFITEGVAASWAAGIIKDGQATSPARYGTWDEFVVKLETAFLPVNAASDAVAKLKKLKQGAGGVDDYIATFRTTVGLTDFKDTAFIIDKFLDGLNDSLRRKVLGNTSEMKTLEDYYGVASRLDANYQYTNTFSSPHPKPNNFRRNIRQVATTDNDVAIQKLTAAERDKLRREGKCFRCRKAGHMSRECPNGRTASRTVRQMEVITEAPADEDISVGRIVAMMSKLPTGERETLTKRMVDEGF